MKKNLTGNSSPSTEYHGDAFAWLHDVALLMTADAMHTRLLADPRGKPVEDQLAGKSEGATLGR